MKGSGWANWNRRYGKSQRGRDVGKIGRKRESLESFAEKSRGPIQRQLWDQELVNYDEQGQIVVNPQKTKETAAALHAETKDRSYGKDYILQLVIDEAA